MRFFHRVAPLTLHDRLRSSAIKECLEIELLQIARRQLSWVFEHIMMSPAGFL